MDADRRDNEPIWRDAFRKILALEAHKGYADNAVSGGIRRFIVRWEPDLRDYLADENRAGHLIEQSYRDLDTDQRRDWVAGWQSALDSIAVAPSSTPDPPVPADRPILPDPVDPPTPSSTPATPSETPGLFAPGETAPMVRYRRRPHVPPTAGASPVDPDQPVSTLRRMDGKTVQRLEQLDVRSVRDLLYTLPRRYDDRADIARIADVYPGDTFTVLRASWSTSVPPTLASVVSNSPRAFSGTTPATSNSNGSARVTSPVLCNPVTTWWSPERWKSIAADCPSPPPSTT